MRCPPKGYVPLTSSILAFLGLAIIWILTQPMGPKGLPSKRYLHFKAFDLIPVSLDGNWTLHDIQRRSNVPKIVKIRHMDDYPAFPSFINDQSITHLDHNWAGNASASSNLLIFNRVQETEYSAVQENLNNLKRSENLFTVWNDSVTHSLSIAEELKFAQSRHFQYPGPHFFEGHFYFVDLASHGVKTQPIWINFVRDPVERIVSNFYSNRSPKRWFLAKQKPPNDYFVKNFDACVLSHDPECQFRPGQYREQQLTYFCGNSPICREIGNHQALAMAKINVERFYSVVGLTSEMGPSLKLLSAKLPKFFQNVTSMEDELKHINHKPYKMPLPGVRRKLTSKLVLEMEFYEFIRQRLGRQLREGL
ncbi:hypothetical protein TCAL_06267 [Tigriopus californicus]|uniref:Uncharacterized protein n=1 Tax=Tigriopus californicus TaxID=6832 RepID=A0A553ND02_TIGCA|nr:heparan sulfate 2-O-sulfotransferase hst-2-like [Tigriopus californicus]TRY63288.1 hypothetical protein TCAL_06267 [Tigriopus californicus]